MWSAWIFAALWNLVSVPAAVSGVRAALNAGNRVALIALLFPAVGVGLLVWAVRATLRYRRFGVSQLDLATLPGVVGHALEGTLRTPEGLRPVEGFRVVLTCIRRVTTGSGDDRSTSETVLWQEEQRVDGTGVTIPVAFAIPADAAPSDPGQASDGTLWRLDVTADVPGVDYAASFEVPVFRTAESARPRTNPERAVAARSGVPAGYQQPPGSPIQVSTTRRGTEIYYPRARNPGAATGLTVFLGIWVAVIWATVRFDAPLILPVVLGLFGLLLLIAVLDQWLTVTRVTAGDGAHRVAGGRYAILRRHARDHRWKAGGRGPREPSGWLG